MLSVILMNIRESFCAITETGGLHCDICAGAFHTKCIGLSDEVFAMLS